MLRDGRDNTRWLYVCRNCQSMAHIAIYVILHTRIRAVRLQTGLSFVKLLLFPYEELAFMLPIKLVHVCDKCVRNVWRIRILHTLCRIRANNPHVKNTKCEYYGSHASVDNIFKRLLLWNHWADWSKFYVEPPWDRGTKVCFKWSWSHDQDCRHAHIW